MRRKHISSTIMSALSTPRFSGMMIKFKRNMEATNGLICAPEKLRGSLKRLTLNINASQWTNREVK